MNQTSLLLKAYFEALYELLDPNKVRLETTIDKLLTEEIKNLGLPDFDHEKYNAYRDACLAFVVERMEAYNPIGIQYTFDRVPTQLAHQLELQLNWFDSTAEFERLKQTAVELAEPAMSDDRLKKLANRMVRQLGAFPDRSIISTYQAAPALPKLPDYILAKAIEEIINPPNI